MLYLFYDTQKFKNVKEFKDFVDGLYQNALTEDPDLSFEEWSEGGFLDRDNFIFDEDAGELLLADDYFRKVYSLR